MNTKNITYQEWEDQFSPIPDPTEPEAFQRFEDAQEVNDELNHLKLSANHVWTMLDGDENLILVSGYHYVNRMYHYICMVPVQGDDYFEIIDD